MNAIKSFLVLLSLYFTLTTCEAQTFRFTDTTFVVGDELIRPTIYNLINCHFEERAMLFTDSLGNFLMKNARLTVVVEFYGDVANSDEYERVRAERCGKEPLNRFLIQSFPTLDRTRITYSFFGTTRPFFSLEQIESMTDRAEKIKAYEKNRRVVVRISSTDFKDR